MSQLSTRMRTRGNSNIRRPRHLHAILTILQIILMQVLLGLGPVKVGHARAGAAALDPIVGIRGPLRPGQLVRA